MKEQAMGFIRKRRIQAMLFLVCSCSAGAASVAQVKAVADPPVLDHSGMTKQGKASYYGRQFYGKKMADGTPMNPDAHVAASRTLPLGTRARVTNLENGKSAVVEIRDRGPYVEGRIVDLSPKVAEVLDFRHQGVALVEVEPLELPQPRTER
jgi:rare lipoprotein A